jgi:hypothetical protein
VEDPREEKVPKIIRTMIRYDHSVGLNRDSTEIAEVGEARLGRGFQEVFSEESLDGLRWKVVRVVGEVEKASLLVFKPFFIKHQALLVSERGGNGSPESLGRIATVTEAKEE